MTTATPPRPAAPRPSRSQALAALLDLPPIPEVRSPQWFERLPRWLSTGGVLVLLLAISAFARTRTLDGQLWFEEAIATGVAHHSLGALPGVLRQAGSAPLYYALLSVWIDIFGMGQAATHALSLVLGLLTIPVAMWLGWSIGGRRAGFFAAVLFAFGSYLTRYTQETQPYALMVLLGLLGTGAFIHGFVFRRRRWLWVFWAMLALMLYTQGTALMFWAGAAMALVVVWWAAAPEARPGIVRDALLTFGGALVVFVPWLPTTISQIAHDTSPWHYTPLLGATIPSQLLGTERVDVTLLIPVVIAVAAVAGAARRRSPQALVFWSLIAISGTAFVVTRILGVVGPFWAWRYFAAIVPALLLLGAFATARARVVGVAAILFCIAFLANAASFAPGYKSDMQDVAAEMAPLLHPGDLVVVGQPEQTPLAWYYLPAGLRFASTTGPVSDPSYMDWSGAMSRLRTTPAQATLGRLVATLKRGQQLLYVRPLTEGAKNWSGSWTQLVRRRSAQWGQVLTNDVTNGTLKPVAWAPHNYRGSCCVADAAVLYQKTS
ncbi:MAG TPA: glycosyltransferase family 39 protein [Solirubrobacteraceae bacterium]|nr:glycosyltransferase family 39 protein [Solirubrobacteraceae bacterium]